MAYTTINKSTEHFNTKLYNGTGSSNAITGVGFEPSFTWIKRRNSATNHHLHNAVSGATKVLYSNSNVAESTDAQKLSSFDSDGFTVGTNGDANNSSGTFVSWNWKAGTGQGSSNTDGSINTTYTSANTTAGFSIIKYAGTGSSGTIGHGLSATPKVCFFKEIDGTESWRVWHRAAPNYSTKALKLNGNDAEFSQTNWVGTVDNSIITIGSDSSINTSGNNYICYAFAEKTGYSKFGSYTGNGNADGTFVYTGFKPAFVIIKNTGAAKNWYLFDNKRETFNAQDSVLYPNLSNAETSVSDYNSLDFLSNGFKLRGGSSGVGDDTNGSYTYIYLAFAEAPLVGSNNVPATAR